jgi:Domain of unknown function (DUF4390)
MASTTRYWPKPLHVHSPLHGLGSMRAMRLFCAALMLASGMVLLGIASAAQAEGITLKAVKIEQTEEGHQINADYEVELAPILFEAVRKGVSLYFVLEVEISQNRWYWLDSVAARASRDRRISYLPLTEQFRLTTSGVSQTVATPDDVRRLLSRVRSWTVAEKGKLKNGERYEAAIRFRLDNSQLPKPFQLNTIGSKEWSLASDWYRWTFTAGKDEK